MGFLLCLLIVNTAMIFPLRLVWPATIMLFAFAGVTSPAAMPSVIVGLVIHAKLSGRPF
jgi:hypothetical protein